MPTKGIYIFGGDDAIICHILREKKPRNKRLFYFWRATY